MDFMEIWLQSNVRLVTLLAQLVKDHSSHNVPDVKMDIS